MEISIGDHHWQVTTFGSGKKVLVAFHGYGQDSSWFKHHEEVLGESYTIYAIDLAYHGAQSNLPKGIEFDELYARRWLESILSKCGESQIGLLGYSIGARIAMTIASWMPEAISELWLIAPDGMPVSKTYRFLIGNFLGKAVFKSFISSPNFAFLLLSAGSRSGLLSKKVAAFYKNEIASISKRQKLYDTWMAYRTALPNYAEIHKQVVRKHLHITCILGKDDRVIPLKRTRNFAMKKIGSVELIELELGHNLLSDKGARLLSDYWK
ncbi:MAG: alpha/beta hydrolase [Bacteroidia bacterium]